MTTATRHPGSNAWQHDLDGRSRGAQSAAAHRSRDVDQTSFVGVVDLKTLTLAGRIESGPGPDGLAWAVQN
jgi:hypothetical protein